jgi:hypothetical protein
MEKQEVPAQQPGEAKPDTKWNIRLMWRINRFSIIVFALAMIWLAVKYLILD